MQLGQLIKRIIKLRIKKIFIWLEFNIEIHGMTGKQCEFSAKKAGKRPLFDEIWLEYQNFIPVDTLLCFERGKGMNEIKTANFWDVLLMQHFL